MRQMNMPEYLKAQRGRVSDVARRLGMHPAYVSQIANGRRPVPAERAADFESVSGGQVRRWEMFPADWHRIWPELIGADGAPSVPSEQDVRDAA